MPGHLVQQSECRAEGRQRRRRDAHHDRPLVRLPGARAERRVASRSAARSAPRWRATSSRCSCSRARRRSTSTASGHHELTPDTAAYIASGESYSIENDGPDPLVALVVDAPTPADADTPALGDASRDRELRDAARRGGRHRPHVPAARRPRRRLLRASRSSWARSRSAARPTTATPTTRSSTSSRARASCTWPARPGRSRPARASTCRRCTCTASRTPATDRMRVLGVFQPAGSPAARYAEEA